MEKIKKYYSVRSVDSLKRKVFTQYFDEWEYSVANPWRKCPICHWSDRVVIGGWDDGVYHGNIIKCCKCQHIEFD